MDDLTREFLIESQEGLDRMERCLTELETRPEDAALLGEIFRSVHTIKGTTGFLGFHRLEKLAHAGENLLGLLRDGKLAADPPLITGLLQLLDGLRSILKSIEADEHEGEGEDGELIERLNTLQVPAAQSREPAAVLHCESLPQQTEQARPVPAAREETPSTASVIVDPRAGDAKPDANSEPSGMRPRASAGSTAAESTLRVDVVLLNRMMNLVGELVLTRNQVLQATAADPNMTMLSRRLDMVTADLRESVMKARMQPVSHIFSKMPRIVRDVSQSLGRRVRLQVEGQDTELDKSLLEAIKDPLTHAVRNALDHGIEPPGVREAAGKDPEGTLTLRASHEGSHVVVEVSDDGAGMDVEKIRRKAIERGVVARERAEQMSQQELLQLVFMPGFSTADAVTNISGRGVGMDVVRTNVEKIGGKVEIDSRMGEGTTLRLRIPLTLAIIPALIVRSAGQSFAVPQGALSELVQVSSEQGGKSIEWIEGAPLYRLRGNLLPLVFLDRLLRQDRLPGAAAENENGDRRDHFIAVLDADGRRFGLVVDGLADPEEIVVKPLSSVLKSIGMYSGATVLGNGALALILDLGAIASRAGVNGTAPEEGACMTEHAGVEESSAKQEYLLVEVAGRRAAVPLESVLRIEQLPLSRVEYLGVRPVLNFEGQLMQVEDAGGVLNSMEQAAANGSEPQVIFVICREGNRQLGIAVSRVLDVASGSGLYEAGTRQRTSGVTLLKDRVTGIVELDRAPSLSEAEGATVQDSVPVEAFA